MRSCSLTARVPVPTQMVSSCGITPQAGMGRTLFENSCVYLGTTSDEDVDVVDRDSWARVRRRQSSVDDCMNCDRSSATVGRTDDDISLLHVFLYPQYSPASASLVMIMMAGDRLGPSPSSVGVLTDRMSPCNRPFTDPARGRIADVYTSRDSALLSVD